MRNNNDVKNKKPAFRDSQSKVWLYLDEYDNPTIVVEDLDDRHKVKMSLCADELAFLINKLQKLHKKTEKRDRLWAKQEDQAHLGCMNWPNCDTAGCGSD